MSEQHEATFSAPVRTDNSYDPVHTLNYLHRKYPNPFAKHVYTVDTLSRTVDPDTGVIRSERLIGVQQGAPGWIKKLFQLPETAYVREVVFIEPEKVKATCMSMNLSLKQYVCVGPGQVGRLNDTDNRSCLELITYAPDPASMPAAPTASGTLDALEPGMPGPGTAATASIFHQRALITSGFSQGYVARKIEQASLDRFGKNAGVGKKGFEWVLAGGQERGERGRLIKFGCADGRDKVASVSGRLISLIMVVRGQRTHGGTQNARIDARRTQRIQHITTTSRSSPSTVRIYLSVYYEHLTSSRSTPHIMHSTVVSGSIGPTQI